MNRDELIEILGKHRGTRWMPLGWECTCGRIIGNASDHGGDSLRVLQAHQAEVIQPLIEADIRAAIIADLREFLPEWNYPPHVVSAICLELKARGGNRD